MSKKQDWLVFGEMFHKDSTRQTSHECKVILSFKKEHPTFQDAFEKLKKKGWVVRGLYCMDKYKEDYNAE